MASETTELTFVRCPSCRSLVPASATRCRICNNPLEVGNKAEDDAAKAGSRVRQKTMTAGPEEVAAAIQKAHAEKLAAETPQQMSRAPVAPVASVSPVEEDEAVDPLGAYLQELDDADAAPVVGADDGEDPFDLDIFKSDPEPAPVRAKAPEAEQPSVRGWDDEPKPKPAQAKPFLEGRPEAIVAPETPMTQPAPQAAARPKPLVSEEPAPRLPTRDPELSSARDSAPRRSGLNLGGGQPMQRPLQEEQRPAAPAPAQQARPEPRQERQQEPPRRNREGQQQQQHRRDNQRTDQRQESRPEPRPEARRDQRQDQARDGGRDQGRQERERDRDRSAETEKHEEMRAPPQPTATPRHGVGPRAGKASPGRLYGWLVSYSSPDGSAIELREGKFFVTAASLKGTDLVLDEPSISTPHALMSVNGERGLQVQDLMSDRGVFLRSREGSQYQREELAVTLEHGDWIRFGDVEFLVTLVPTSKSR